MSLLTRLRQAPPETQTHVAFLIAVAIMLIIVSLWVVSLPARFAAQREAAAAEKGATADVADNETLTSVLRQFTASTTDAVKDLNTVFDNANHESAIVITDVGASTTNATSAIITP